MECPIDKEHFASPEELGEHMEDVHKMGIAKPELVEAVKNAQQLPQNNFNPVLTPETIPVPKKETPPPVVDEKRDPEEITLAYKYDGECPKCFTKVTTFMLDTGSGERKSLYCVAYCPSCNKQLKSRKVVAL